MKKIETIIPDTLKFIVAKDITARLNQEPQLPSRGYVDGVIVSATSVYELFNNYSAESRLIAPCIVVSKSMFFSIQQCANGSWNRLSFCETHLQKY